MDLAHDGRGVARIDGKAVFVEGALPWERVRLRVVKRRRHMDEAGLVEVLTRFAGSRRCRAARTLAFAAAAPCSICRAGGAAGRETTSIAGESPAHRQRAAAAGARAAARTGMGLPAQGAARGQVCAQEGPGAGGFSRTRKALYCRHAPLRGIAGTLGFPAAGAGRAGRDPGDSRENSAGGGGGGRRCGRPGVSGAGAAGRAGSGEAGGLRRGSAACRSFCSPAASIRCGRCATTMRRSTTRSMAATSSSNSDRSISCRSIATSMPRWSTPQ